MVTSISDKPFHDTQAYQVNEDRGQSIFFALLLTVSVLGGFTIFLSTYMGQLKDGVDRWIILGLYASTLALILACAYFFAFRFFEDLFYLFIAIGWLANACYLPFEFLFKSNCKPDNITADCLHFLLYTYAISLITSVSFYVSTLIEPEETSPSPRRVMGIWVGAALVATGIAYIFLNYVSPTNPFDFQFLLYTIPGALFSGYGLFRVGRHITGVLKLPKKKMERTLRVLSATFYAYAILQLAYPFKIYLTEADKSWLFYSLFVVAFLIKITNAYCLVKVLLQVKYPEIVRAKSELEAVQDRLKRRSHLAALGIISAVIEHDMKTPLAGISTRLALLRHFHGDGKAKKYIDELEIDRNRLSAIAKIVPFLRGAQEYYDRDRFMGRVSLYELIDRVISAVKVEWNLDTEKFFFRINPNASGKSQPRRLEFFVRAYTPMIEQMVVNLFKNGIEAIRETGRDNGVFTIKVNTIRKVPEELGSQNQLKEFTKWVQVEIEDTGCGIPPENLPKLTSLFTTKKDRKPNSGIGLFIARILIKIHDGCIDIKSVLGKGTTVLLYLPEWDAYQAFVILHPESIKSAYDFDEDIAALEIPTEEVKTVETT